jgi:hypothetical protein
MQSRSISGQGSEFVVYAETPVGPTFELRDKDVIRHRLYEVCL